MSFIKYPKIYAPGKEDLEGFFDDPQLETIVQEKLGANASIWVNRSSDKEACILSYGSRSQKLGEIIYPDPFDSQVFFIDEKSSSSFRGFSHWLYQSLLNNETFIHFMMSNLNKRIFGEWLVPHTVKYPTHFYNKFYAYDIFDNENNLLEPFSAMKGQWPECIPRVPTIDIFPAGMVVEINMFKPLVGKSPLMGTPTGGEGIVIKRYGYRNRFGRQQHMKIVDERFREDHRIKSTVEGWPLPKGEIEEDLMKKFFTPARVIKIIQKIRHDKTPHIYGPAPKAPRPEMSWIPEVMGRHWKDLWEEEIHAIIKASKGNDINFNRFKKIHDLTVKRFFIDFLERN